MNNGYLVPENAQPETVRCVRVYVPDDPLYMASLIGSLTYLGTWTAWKRDEARRGRLAALAWKHANEKTLDDLSLGCDCDKLDCELCDMTQEELRQLIAEELEAMSIVINNNMGCGCGCGSGDSSVDTGEEIAPVTIPPDEIVTIPPYNSEVVDLVDASRCRSANYLADRILYMMRGLGQLGNGAVTIAVIVGVLAAIISWLTPVVGDEIVMTALVAIAYRISTTLSSADDFVFENFDRLADEIEANMQEFVCTLYDWSTATELGGALQLWLNQKIDDVGGSTGMSFNTTSAMKAVVNELIGSNLINGFVNNISKVVPADFVARYACACNFDWPDEVTGYEWRIGLIEETVSSPHTANLDLNGDGWRYDFSIPTSATNWEATTLISPPTLNTGEEVVGVTYLISETATAGGVNDPNNGAVDISGIRSLGGYRFLWWLTGHNVIQDSATFDAMDEENNAQILSSRTFQHYARVGTGQTPPGTGHAIVSAVLWCIKLA